jgi:hypothetical protein
MPGATHTLRQLLEIAHSPFARAEYSYQHGPAFALIDCRVGITDCDPAIHAALPTLIRKMHCPVIGLSSRGQTDSILDVFDVVVDSDIVLEAILRNISRAPATALVLVQLLRETEGLPSPTALLMESLAFGTLQAGSEHRRWLGNVQNHPDFRDSGMESLTAKQPPVLLERKDDRLFLTLNRPCQRNAISVEMRDALLEPLRFAIADNSIKSIELTGAGPCFSIGGNVKEFGSALNPADAHAVRSVQSPAWAFSECAERLQVHVHSACIGAGIELAAFAKKLSAAPNTFFALPEITFGLIPGAGGTVSISRRIGRQRTAWLALSGRRISAATALHWKLIDRIEHS